jgi:hypothetical protein
MKDKLILFKNWAIGIFKDKFVDVLKWILDKPVKRIVGIILSLVGISVGASQMETITKTMQTLVVDQEMRNQLTTVIEQNRQVYQELQTAKATNIFQKKEFDKRFNEFASITDKNFKVLNDSISKLNKKIIQFSQGQGTVSIEGSGVAKEGMFYDDWITANIVPLNDKGEYDLRYWFNFLIKDVSVTVEDENGVKNEVYSVNIVSQKDTTKKLYVNDYKKEITVSASVPIVPVKPQSNTINAGISYSGYGLEGALSYSFFTFGNFKMPDVALSTDFENSVNLFAGVRYNIGDPLPLFTNLWLNLGYGFNLIQGKKNIIIGIGTTL